MRAVAIEELPDYDASDTVIYTPAFVNMESHSWVRAPRLSMIFRIAVNMRLMSRNVLENVPKNLGGYNTDWAVGVETTRTNEAREREDGPASCVKYRLVPRMTPARIYFFPPNAQIIPKIG